MCSPSNSLFQTAQSRLCVCLRHVLRLFVGRLFTYFPHEWRAWYSACYWPTSIEGSVVTTVTARPSNVPFPFTPTAVSTPPCICYVSTQHKGSAYVGRWWHCAVINVLLEVTNTGPIGYQAPLLCTRHHPLWTEVSSAVVPHLEMSKSCLQLAKVGVPVSSLQEAMGVKGQVAACAWLNTD